MKKGMAMDNENQILWALNPEEIKGMDMDTLIMQPELLSVFSIQLESIKDTKLAVIEAQVGRIGQGKVNQFTNLINETVRDWLSSMSTWSKQDAKDIIAKFDAEDLSHLERLIPEDQGGTLESELHLMNPEYQEIHNDLKNKGEI